MVRYPYATNRLTPVEMLTRDLKKSNDNLVVHGKLILNLSTNLSQPANGPSNAASRPSLSANLTPNGAPHGTPSQSSLHAESVHRPGAQSQRSSTVNPAGPVPAVPAAAV